MLRNLRPCAGLFLLAACYSGGDPLRGLGVNAGGTGPLVAWDLDAKPLPDIPFPNDVATRPDRNAATGRRVNASIEAPTSFERRLRRHIAELDGFGTFNPMWVRFDSPDPDRPELARLDLERIAAVQKADTHFADDVVLVINVTRQSPTYGQAAVLDFGNGNFPVTLEDEDEYFESDPRPCASNIIFDTYDEDADRDGVFDVWEDTNQNGQLDPGEDRDGDGRMDGTEDTDGDGTFDHPNLWGTYRDTLGAYDPCAAGDLRDYQELLTFYELDTETLWFRPVYPLEERTTYAVVLLRDLVGQHGGSVQSPFPFVHHLQQTPALRPLFEDGLLARYGRDGADVAFAWSFTTQSVTEGLVKLREGLYGIGPFSHLSSRYPAEVEQLVPMADAPGVEAWLLQPRQIVDALELIFDKIDIGGYDKSRIQELVNTYGAVDYVVAGDYISPNFLDAGDGVFDIDLARGTGRHQGESLRFIMVVPKSTYGTPPFPVALYCHGYTSLKLEALAFAGGLAKFGIATFAIDAPSHGLPLGGEYESVFNDLIAELGGKGLLPFFNAIKKDRARDLNNDTFTEPGGDFWTNDMFHTRDIVRQTVVDYMQAIRMLRGFDGTRTWRTDTNGDGQFTDLAGDFNADGVIDIGGPDADFFVLGTSMGGINSTIIGGIEPAIRAAAPISPGGGLLEVGLRTDLGNVKRAVILPIMGPMVVGRPHSGDSRLTVLEWLVNDVFSKRTVAFATVGELRGGEVVGELRPGDLFEIENLANGNRDEVVVGPGRAFRAHLGSDKHDPVVIRIRRPTGELVREISEFGLEVERFQGDQYQVGDRLVAIQEGLGYRRNTPNLRRLIGLAQMILEPADPVNYGVRYADPVTVRPEGASPTNLLLVLTLGDMTVPISTGVALARAAGIVNYLDVDPTYGKSHNQLLIDTHVVEAVDKLRYFADDPCHYHSGQVNFDIDDLSDGLHPSALPRLGGIVRPPACVGTNPPPACAAACRPLPPLRATAATARGVRAARFPALDPRGQHAIDLPDSTLPFDPSMFIINQVGLFLGSGGQVLSDHRCLAKNDCSTCAGEPDCPTVPTPPVMPTFGD